MKQIATLFLLLFIATSCSNYGEVKVFNETEVYYKDGVTEADAEKLGEGLISSGFADGTPKSVQLLKDDDIFVFKMVIQESYLNDKNMEGMFSIMPKELTEIMGSPVDFHLTNNTFDTQKVYKYEDAQKSVMAKATEVRYTKQVTMQEVNAFKDFLISFGFANDDKPKTVVLDKENEKYIVKVVFNESDMENKGVLAVMSLMKNQISKEVFKGSPVKIHLTDDMMNTKKEI